MTDHHWILKDGQPVKVKHWLTWARWFEDGNNRIVKQEDLGKEYWVSTVFLGLDHNYGSGPPILWETMVFKKLKKPLKIGIGTIEIRRGEVDCDRCSGNWEQAEAMHERMMAKWGAK